MSLTGFFSGICYRAGSMKGLANVEANIGKRMGILGIALGRVGRMLNTFERALCFGSAFIL